MISLGLTFVMWGATGRVNLDFTGGQPWAAKVNGERIDRREVEEAWRNRQSEYQQQTGKDLSDEERTKLPRRADRGLRPNPTDRHAGA
jgi:hypothetical protein